MRSRVTSTIYALSFVSASALAQQAPQTLPDMRGGDLVYKGIQAHDREQYDSAIAWYSWVHPNDSSYSWAVAEKANTLYSAKKYQEVITLCEDALRQPIGHRGFIYMTLGSAYDDSEQPEKAINAYDRGIAESPMLDRLHFNKAVTLIGLERYPEAYEALKRALTINPYHASSHYTLGLIALQQGEYVPATLAISTFLILEPRQERSLNILASLNDALSEKQETKNLGIDFGEDFGKLNLVVRNYAALRESYKTPSDFTLPVVKQAHLIFAQLKLDKKGWISNFYGSFYKDVVADDKLFEGFSYLIMVPSTSEGHQKIVNQNIAKITKFIEWAQPNWENRNNYITDTLQGKTQEVRYLRRDNKSVEAVGQWDKVNDKPSGFIRIYDSNGTLTSFGSFNKNGEREGRWQWFYDNGLLREEQTYVNGKAQGKGSFYDNTGKLAVTQEWKDGKREGKRNAYHANGQLMLTSVYVNDELTGPYKTFYPQGQIEFEVELKAGKQVGTGIGYYPDGKKQSQNDYSDGLRNGTYLGYYPNGQISEKTTYINDLAEGPHQLFYANGTVKAEGQFVKDMRSGSWKRFYPDGALDYTEEYDENGKMTGVYRDYDKSGTVVNELEYKSGEVIAHRYFDSEGKLIAEQKARKGKLPFKAYHSNRLVAAEGVFNDGKKDGLWIYYNAYGRVESREQYKNGNLNGFDKAYYADEKLANVILYTDDKRQGLTQNFYPDSTLKAQGRYVNGVQEGSWYEYNPDGSLNGLYFFVGGKLDGWQKYYTTTGVLHREFYMRENLVLAYKYYGPTGEILGEGELENGTGTIEWKYPNGQRAYATEVKNGQYHGKTETFYPDGTQKFKGQNLFDESVGEWIWYHPNGKIETKGSYQANAREGKWFWFYDNGNRSTVSEFEAGDAVGARKDYNREGKIIALGNYLSDELHGPRYSFGLDSAISMVRIYHYGVVVSYTYPDKTGNLLAPIPLKNGDAEVQTFYPNGTLAQKFSYVGGQFDGVYERYYQNGTLMHKSNNRVGRDEGEQKEYYSNGKLGDESNNTMNFKHGKARLYHPNGKLYRDENYAYDQLEGEVMVYNEAGQLTRKEFWFNGNLFSFE
jgi:antitoxin component YwqK of YwqJK toxin-antitoxin module